MAWYKVTNTSGGAVGFPGVFLRPGDEKVITDDRIEEGARRLEKRGLISIKKTHKPSIRMAKANKLREKTKKENIVSPDPEYPAKDYVEKKKREKEEQDKKEPERIEPEHVKKKDTVAKIKQGPLGEPVAGFKEKEDDSAKPLPDYDKQVEQNNEEAQPSRREELMGVKIGKLRSIGDALGVKGRSKEDLVDRIIEAESE